MEGESDIVFEELVQEYQKQFLCYKERANKRFQELEGLLEVAARKMEVLKKKKVRKRTVQFVNPFAKEDVPEPRSKKALPQLRLAFPKFDAKTGVKEWLQDCENYFEIFQVGKEKQVAIAGMHLEGTARKWFQTYAVGRTHWQWTEFCNQITNRFGAWEQDLLFDNFKKLKQESTVEAYYTDFEKYKAQLQEKMPVLTEEFFVESFVGGLKAPIQETLLLLNPVTVEQALKLARICPDPVMEVNKKNSPGVVSGKGSERFLRTGQLSAIQEEYFEETNPQTPTQISPKQLEIRMREGYCPYCSEKEGSFHQCAKPSYFAIVQDGNSPISLEAEEQPSAANEESQGSNSTEQMEVSVHAIEGFQNNKTITLTGRRGNQSFSILVDGGSTHSFLDEHTATRLKCELVQTQPMRVQVANGSHLVSQYECPGFSWKIGDKEFKNGIRTLPMGGYDLVLGVDWLGSLGLVTFDYKNLTLQFEYKGQKVTLQGKAHGGKPRLQQMSAKAFVRSCQRQGNGFLYVFNHTTQPQVSEMKDVGREPTKLAKEQVQLQSLLQEYEDIFKPPVGLPPNRSIEHSIELKEGSQPFSIRPYRNSFDQKNEIERLVTEMLETGIIRPSTSPFASPILLVKKKDGTWRFCIDYRRLNSLTIKNKFPIPLIEELLDELGGAEFFTKLDLRAGYHQVRMKEKDIEKTAFRTHSGHYEFIVMPFGLTNAPATFQNLMNKVFEPFLRKFTLVFFDDILVYSKAAQDHLQHLELVFEVMRQHKLFAKQSKCDFMKDQVAYLGHVISKAGVAVDGSKVADMLAWPLPQNIKALRGFLGLSGYYRKFVKGYGTIAKPLTMLLQKDHFHWSDEATVAFNNLKTALTNTPILKLPDYTKVFTVETDASNSGIGAVLTQEGHPLAYFSKSLGIRGQAMSTYEKELMAVVAAVKKWTPYLMDKRFYIKTDHYALKFLSDQKVNNLIQQKWLSKLLGYDYTILYRKGSENTVADALSRRDAEPVIDKFEESTELLHEDMDLFKGERMSG